MLTVIENKIVAIFAYSAAGPFHDVLRRISGILMGLYPDLSASGKFFKTCNFNPVFFKSLAKASIMNDSFFAGINTMMGIAKSLRDEMIAKLKLHDSSPYFYRHGMTAGTLLSYSNSAVT